MRISLVEAAIQLNIGQLGRVRIRDFESLLSELEKSGDIDQEVKSVEAWKEAFLAVDPDVLLDDNTTDTLSKVDEYMSENDLSQEEVVERLEKYDSMTGGRPSKTEKWAGKIQSGDAKLEEAKEALPESTFYKMKREYDVDD